MIKINCTQVILLAPDWAGRVWYPEDLGLSMSSNEAAPFGEPTVTATGQGLHPDNCNLHLHVWQHLNTFYLPPEVVNVILEARLPQTRTVYARCWNKFVAWCCSWQLDALQDNVSNVLMFALPLAWQGLALGTVKGYLWTLSVFLWLPDQPSLFKLVSSLSLHHTSVGP